MFQSTRRVAAAIAFTLLGLLPATAGEGVGPAGYWSGAIEVPGSPIAISVDLSQGADGSWSARISIPAQGVHDAALVDVTVDGAKAGFRIDQVPGEPTFAGTLSEDAKSLGGNFTQAGQNLPFKLARAERPASGPDLYAEYTADGEPGSGLAGRWLGIIASGPHRLRVQLIVEGEPGALRASFVSVDQGGAKIAAEVATTEDGSVKIGIPAAGGSIAGTMSADGSTIDASWSQAGNKVPLKLNRSPTD